MANTSIAFTQDIVEGLNRKDKQMILTNLIFYAFRQLGDIHEPGKAMGIDLPDTESTLLLKKLVSEMLDVPSKPGITSL